MENKATQVISLLKLCLMDRYMAIVYFNYYYVKALISWEFFNDLEWNNEKHERLSNLRLHATVAVGHPLNTHMCPLFLPCVVGIHCYNIIEKDNFFLKDLVLYCDFVSYLLQHLLIKQYLTISLILYLFPPCALHNALLLSSSYNIVLSANLHLDPFSLLWLMQEKPFYIRLSWKLSCAETTQQNKHANHSRFWFCRKFQSSIWWIQHYWKVYAKWQ